MNHSDDYQDLINFYFYKTKELYGDAVDSFWMYEKEICPCCSKRKIDRFKLGDELLVSLNAYCYRDMRVLIGYLLCGTCITELVHEGKQQKKLYQQLENKLKKEYLNDIKSTSS